MSTKFMIAVARRQPLIGVKETKKSKQAREIICQYLIVDLNKKDLPARRPRVVPQTQTRVRIATDRKINDRSTAKSREMLSTGAWIARNRAYIKSFHAKMERKPPVPSHKIFLKTL